MRHLYTLLFFLSVPFFINAGPAYNLETVPSVVPIQIRNKLILVEGEVDGRRGLFLFDTGASELILNEAYFPRHEHYSPDLYFADAGGHSALHGYTYISSFDWGGLRRHGFFAPRLAMLTLESILEEELLGIIGYDVLQHVDLEFNYYQKTITLLRPGSEVPGTAMRIRPDYTFGFSMNRHLPVVKAKLGDADGLLLAIDSGSSVNVCAHRLKGKLKGRALQKRTIGLHGAAGIIKESPYYIMDSLQVENTYSIAYCRVAFSNLEALEDYGLRVDGLLGVNFFRLGRVFFSYHSRRIAVWLERNDYTLRHSSLDEDE